MGTTDWCIIQLPELTCPLQACNDEWTDPARCWVGGHQEEGYAPLAGCLRGFGAHCVEAVWAAVATEVAPKGLLTIQVRLESTTVLRH